MRSGELIAPGIPQAAEHELMEKLVDTYGKTFHTWHTDHGDALPLGVPQVMMGFTADGQLDPKRLADRNQRFGVDPAEKRANRADLPQPAIVPGANAWEQGRVVQVEDPTARGAPTAPPRRP